jgi:hypothetical protein
MSPLSHARKLYTDFSGNPANESVKITIPNPPKVGICIGDIDGIMYTTERDGEIQKYIHTFKSADRPLFVVSPDGSQLFIVGGHYTFTERGIVDKSDKSR